MKLFDLLKGITVCAFFLIATIEAKAMGAAGEAEETSNLLKGRTKSLSSDQTEREEERWGIPPRILTHLRAMEELKRTIQELENKGGDKTLIEPYRMLLKARELACEAVKNSLDAKASLQKLKANEEVIRKGSESIKQTFEEGQELRRSLLDTYQQLLSLREKEQKK